MRFEVGLLSLLATVAFAKPGNFGQLNKRQNDTAGYSVKTPPLDTPWTYEVGTNPWPEYPRPLLERSNWKNLNGVWQHQNVSSLDAVNSPPFGGLGSAGQPVLIPSCLESGLSGVQGEWMLYSWFSTSFTVPSNWTGQTILLNFAAVDYEATVFVNGQQVGFHRGGYFEFTLDITDAISNGTAEHELLVFVYDPTDSDEVDVPLGKQTLNPSHIFYTPCSGIWQSVWIESAPSNYITDMNLNADMNGNINATVGASQSNGTSVTIDVKDKASGSIIGTGRGSSGQTIQFTVSDVELWSPDSPTLYDVEVRMGIDHIKSYTAFRSVGRGEIDGIQRPLLNGEFIFTFGTLDQGFWPDGIYTPPNREAMVYDLKTLKSLGFNMLRKHIKVETGLFYQACDQMGLLLIQDMPALRTGTRTLDNCTVVDILPDADQQAEFQRQLELLITQHRNYPSIFTWVIYNEGWGQITDGEYPEFGLADIVRSIDPTRLIDATSGWYYHGAGDYHDNHHYANPQCGTPFYSTSSAPYDPSKIGIQGEFGGIGENTTIDHLWNVQAAIDTINATYEIDLTNMAWNYRAHILLTELTDQTRLFSCSGAVWTQTTDVEGEVNGLLTYDRRVLRPDVSQWQSDISGLYAAAAARNGSVIMESSDSYGSGEGSAMFGGKHFGPSDYGGGHGWGEDWSGDSGGRAFSHGSDNPPRK